MPLWMNPPLALFVLAKVDHEGINAILRDAQSQRGSEVPWLWLATPDYAEAPKKKVRESNLGTEAPIPDSFNWPFVGRKLEDVAKWLKDKPGDVDLDAHHFGIIDRVSGKDKSIIACKRGDRDLKGDQLDYRRYPAARTSILLQGLEPDEWEEIHTAPTDTKIEYEGDS